MSETTMLVELTMTRAADAEPVLELATYGKDGVPIRALHLTWHPTAAARIEAARRAAADAWGLELGPAPVLNLDLAGGAPGDRRRLSLFLAEPLPTTPTSGDTETHEGAVR